MNIAKRFAAGSLLLSLSVSAYAAMSDHTALPPTQVTPVDPNVMFNLSIETPMQGAAYNDQNDGGSCSGRLATETVTGLNGKSVKNRQIGGCYFPAQEYLGYFDPNKCYVYQSGAFEPSGATNANHECSGKWSGNLLNWATMTAIDEFRWALTGGHRVVDTATGTVLQRAYMWREVGDNWFPVKKLNASINVAPSTVTPYSGSTIYLTSVGTQLYAGTSGGKSDLLAPNSVMNLHVRVCVPAQGLEANCQAYGSNYKPEGLVQENAKRMRFAVMSYLNDNSHGRDGGVLRANMKYVGPERPAVGGGLTVNSETEWSAATGVFVTNPNPADATASSVNNSGVINYINKFGANGYKSYDPIGELFYECLNYYKNRGPTSDYYSDATATHKDDFPVITAWSDPIQHQCQANYIVGINDANPWEDKQLPGTATTASSYHGYSWRAESKDWGGPSNPDTDINVTTLTNTVGDLQGITGTSRKVGCVPGNCNMSNTYKTIDELGKAFGTAPGPGKQNSYYIAGLAYYANTNDIRDDVSLPGRQTVTTFMIDTQEYNANPLTGEMNMLWLAGKYGGFTEQDLLDTNSDKNPYEPNLSSEWDEDNDGVPDNYVLASDPKKLVEGLAKAFRSISERVSAGSAAAVVGNTADGDGAIVQALYQPKVNNTARKQLLEWGGILHGIFVDKLGNFREDNQSSGTQGKLDDYATDQIIRLFYDTSVVPNRARVQRYSADADGSNPTASGAPIEIEDLGVIWNARDQLSHAGANMTAQRNYTSPFVASGTPRHIFAGIDKDQDGIVEEGETEPFTHGAMSTYFRYLDVATAAEAEKLVKFIRGEEGLTDYRNRTIDYDGDGVDEVWRLGDIVHSSPTVVGPPAHSYDADFGDDTYADYRAAYAGRRQVVYVGANDGMLHAFNMGFYNDSTFELSPNGETAHPLGAELWAYVPGNLLPHLQWLASKQYPHVYYMDGPVQQFDVNIFEPDSTHVGGWGTIIVVGMHLGGGDVDLDLDGDSTDDYTTHSAYVIMDVTDPEQPPKLLAEVTHADLGYTTSLPTVRTDRAPAADGDWSEPSDNDWYLVFGSGPTDLDTAESSQNARLYQFNLNTKLTDPDALSFVSGFAPLDLGVANSFVGNIGVWDWDRDWIDDSLYFGLVEDTVAAPNGRLLQLLASATSATTLFDTPAGQPIVGRPSFAMDELGNGWVYFGTGRLFTRYDNQSTPQQALYGIKDPVVTDGKVGASTGTVVIADLQETTGVLVYSNGKLEDPDSVIAPALTADTFSDLQQRIATKDGWYRELDASTPSQRSFTNPLMFFSFMLSTSYKPNLEICEPEGNSYIHALYYKTGTSFPGAGLGNDSALNPNGGYETLADKVIGRGTASDVVILTDGSHGGGAVATTNLSTGVLASSPITPPATQSGRQSWREILIY